MMDRPTLRTPLDAGAVKRAHFTVQGSGFGIEIEAPGRSVAFAKGQGALRLRPRAAAAAPARTATRPEFPAVIPGRVGCVVGVDLETPP